MNEWHIIADGDNVLVIVAVILIRVILSLLAGGPAESANPSKIDYKCGYTRCTRSRSVVPVPGPCP